MGFMGTIINWIVVLIVFSIVSKWKVWIWRLYQRIFDILDWWIFCKCKLQVIRQQGVNFLLMGSSLFQVMSVIGYCLIPLSLLGLIVSILNQVLPIWVKMIIILLALCWSTVSCLIVMRDLVSEERKWLCAYPISLFYIFLGWYAIVAWCDFLSI